MPMGDLTPGEKQIHCADRDLPIDFRSDVNGDGPVQGRQYQAQRPGFPNSYPLTIRIQIDDDDLAARQLYPTAPV